MRKNDSALSGRRVILLVVSIVIAAVSRIEAYDQYSVARDATNCRACHGAFAASGYVSKVDNQTWTQSLHDTHRNTMVSGDCEVCHSASGRFPVSTSSSAGGTGGLAPISCVGCHGRSQDGTGTGTVGYGAGLRQRHWRGAVTVCLNCHTDANPANKTVVGENVKPPYYANPAGHTLIPTDPCNPPTAYVENFQGTTIGLDNDGNGQFDMADPACSGAPVTPGEVSRTTAMLVTAYNKVTGDVSISYAPGCAATNTKIEYGPLSALATYGYGGQVCGLGSTGAATFGVPNGSFFLVVSTTASREGSYGTRRTGIATSERPRDAVNLSCALQQDLANRCDP